MTYKKIPFVVDLERQKNLREEIFAVDGDKEDLYEDEEDLFAPDDGALQGDFTGDYFFVNAFFKVSLNVRASVTDSFER